MTQRRAGKTKPIPKFSNEAEAAAFWDTHSPLDYPEEFREVEVTFSRPLIKRGLTVKLSDETIQRLKKIADEKGIGPSTLVRMWVLERLSTEDPERNRNEGNSAA